MISQKTGLKAYRDFCSKYTLFLDSHNISLHTDKPAIWNSDQFLASTFTLNKKYLTVNRRKWPSRCFAAAAWKPILQPEIAYALYFNQSWLFEQCWGTFSSKTIMYILVCTWHKDVPNVSAFHWDTRVWAIDASRRANFWTRPLV